jgi:hypothetical protein
MFLSVYHYECNANHYFKIFIIYYAIDLDVILVNRASQICIV